jgi:hypothetical protein
MTGFVCTSAASIIVDNAKRHDSLQRTTSSVSVNGVVTRWTSTGTDAMQGTCPICPKRRISDDCVAASMKQPLCLNKYEKLPSFTKARALPDFDRFVDDDFDDSPVLKHRSSLDFLLSEAIDICDHRPQCTHRNSMTTELS